MKNRVLSLHIILAMLLSFAVVPVSVSAAGISEANWEQYEGGLYTSTSDFKECFKEYTDTSYGDDQLTAVKMVATSTKTLSDNDRNPVAYKYGENSEAYGEHADDEATYAHMRFYLASFSDEYRSGTNYS